MRILPTSRPRAAGAFGLPLAAPGFDDLLSWFSSLMAAREPGGSQGTSTLTLATWRMDLVQVTASGQGGTTIQVAQVSGASASLQVPSDPLLLDLDGRGPSTSGLAHGRPFDLQGKGQVRTTSFVSGGSAFLALDRNGNGRIDDGGELFGDQHGAADGFEELRRFDADRNGRIDAKDPVFTRLELLKGDGSVLPLSEAHIQALQLGATASSASFTSGGDPIFRQARAVRDDGTPVDTFAIGLHQT